ncbi:response regulator transcription factor [Sediminicoccus sp. BL-A-41-H5]|uniref:response regulator transcription factor n=1 Tax=Sediminicoccus sp. BL-A-41-H5 TaxID=3421106 RepID=UPI003D67F0FB
MTQGPRILLLDDDTAFCDAITAYLEAQGCIVAAIQRPDGLEAAILKHNPDLLLLDQRLGDTTGTQLLREMRPRSNLPCIVVTGASDPFDRILNLELGADDEIDKSTAPRELLARIRAVLRRERRPSVERANDAPASPWQFVISRRELRRPDGSQCHLTTAEFETLRMLVESIGISVSRAIICQRVFGRPYQPADRAVDTVVKKLRLKIDTPGGSTCIRSVRPMGYVFTGFPAAEESRTEASLPA